MVRANEDRIRMCWEDDRAILFREICRLEGVVAKQERTKAAVQKEFLDIKRLLCHQNAHLSKATESKLGDKPDVSRLPSNTSGKKRKIDRIDHSQISGITFSELIGSDLKSTSKSKVYSVVCSFIEKYVLNMSAILEF